MAHGGHTLPRRPANCGSGASVNSTTAACQQASISGNPVAAKKACQKAPAGRIPPPGTLGPNGKQIPPRTPGQSYNNCGIEASRQIINQATNANVGQEALLNQAMNNGWATRGPTLYDSGGSNPADRAAMLTAYNVPSSTVPTGMANLEPAVAQGCGVIASVDAGILWPKGSAPLGSYHAILVTGVEYDKNGNAKNVIINDTGMGTCGQSIDVNRFKRAMQASGKDLVVTNNPVW